MPRLILPTLFRGPIALIAAVLFLAPATAGAGYADYDITRARLSMQRVDYLLSDAEWAADVARDDLERADRRASELSAEVARQEREVDDASRRLDDADRASHWLREDVDRLLGKIDERKKELDAAAERLRAAREAVDKLTADAVAGLEAGEGFRTASAAAEEAGKALEAAEKTSIEVLALTADHRAAVTVVEALQTRIQFLTDQGDRAADELAAAQKELADGRNRLRDMEDRHLAQDPQVADAERRFAQAEQAVKSLRDDFQKQLDQRPEVADARKAALLEQENYDATLRSLQNTESQVVDAQDQLRRHEEVARLERDRLDNANDQLNKLLDELRDADAFADASSRRLRDALEAVECGRRERDAAAWSLARAEQADAFYRWDAPVYGHSWTVVHIGRVDCDPFPTRPVYWNDPDCYRPAWCQPLTSFRRPAWSGGFGWSHYRRWRDDDCRPVVVKVVKYRTPVVVREVVRRDSRRKATLLAGRTAGDERRVQRQAAVEKQRKQVVERRERIQSTRLVGGPTHAGQLALGQFPMARAQMNERALRQQKNDAERATRVAAVRAERERRVEAKKVFEARRQGGRDKPLEQAAARGDFAAAEKLRGQQLRQANIEARSTMGPVANVVPGSDESKRLRWAERRDRDQREREQRRQEQQQTQVLRRQQKEQKAQAVATARAVAKSEPGQTGSAQPEKASRREERRVIREERDASQDAVRQAKAAQESAERKAQQQQRAEREAAQQQKPQREPAVEQLRRQERQQEAAADRAAREQRQQEQQSAKQQAEESRRAAVQAERQREAEVRQQRQAQEASRDSARQQAFAEERAQRQAQRDASEQARSSQREANREAARQSEQSRSAEREAQRSAERESRRAVEESRRSEASQRNNNDRPDNSDRGGRRR
jgi:hypothetical protein